VISFAYWTTSFLVVQRVTWAWVKADHRALRFVALSPNARGMAENMYRGIVVMDRLRVSEGDRQLYDETKARERTERSGYGVAAIPHEMEVPIYERPASLLWWWELFLWCQTSWCGKKPLVTACTIAGFRSGSLLAFHCWSTGF
jgi:hypothetical protein